MLEDKLDGVEERIKWIRVGIFVLSILFLVENSHFFAIQRCSNIQPIKAFFSKVDQDWFYFLSFKIVINVDSIRTINNFQPKISAVDFLIWYKLDISSLRNKLFEIVNSHFEFLFCVLFIVRIQFSQHKTEGFFGLQILWEQINDIVLPTPFFHKLNFRLGSPPYFFVGGWKDSPLCDHIREDFIDTFIHLSNVNYQVRIKDAYLLSRRIFFSSFNCSKKYKITIHIESIEGLVPPSFLECHLKADSKQQLQWSITATTAK